MRYLLLPFSPRYIVLTLAALGTAMLAALVWRDPQDAVHLAVPLGLFSFLTLVGIRDLVQTKHAILRNYPFIAHIASSSKRSARRAPIFFEGDTDGMPFRVKARHRLSARQECARNPPFGTHDDVYPEEHEWMLHSIAPRPPQESCSV